MQLNDPTFVPQPGGYKKGEFIIFKSRRGTGKSMYLPMYSMMKFASSWTEWKPEWTWRTRVSSRSGKIIWGRIMVRTSKFVISGSGLLQQRATPKEAYDQQKEEFKRALS